MADSELQDREARRLAALHDFAVLDTPPEAPFDEIAQLASDLCGTPIAIVNLIGEGRQFFKAEVGIGVRETPLETSFCAKALLEDDFLLVPDATKDDRFNCNPLVTAEPHLRFYAGALLKTSDGLPIGTLCVLDYKPKALTEVQERALRVLARQVMTQLELRLALRRRSESDARHRAIVESATDYAIIATDLSGRITEWNSGAEAILGWRDVEMLGQTAERIFTPGDRGSGVLANEMENARVVGRGIDDRWHLHKDGSRFWASGAMMPLKGQGDELTGYIKVLRDRTDERRRGQRLALLSDIASGLLDADDPDIILGPVLEQSTELLGFDESYSYVLTPDCEHLHLTHSVGASQEIRDRLVHASFDLPICGIVAQTRKPVIIDHLLETTEPRYAVGRACGYNAFAAFPVLIDDKLHGVMSFATRTRSSFDAEALAFFATLARYVAVVRSRIDGDIALRDSEEKLRFAMEAAGQGSWELDLNTFDLIASGHCKANFGRSTDETFTYTDLQSCIHPADIERMREAVRSAVKARAVYDIEYRVVRPDGSEGWVQVTGRPTYADDGSPLAMLGVSRDITARKADELALKDLNERLEQRVGEIIAERELAQSALRQSQKMEAMGQLTGGVAHDFNNLLTPIIGGLDLVQRRLTLSEREARLIDGALQSAERAKTLVQRLLAFARRQPLQRGSVDMASLVAGMVELIASTAGSRFVVKTDIQDALPPAHVDANQLEMAILNLAVNARDAMPDGGTLTISAVLDPDCDVDSSALHGQPCIRMSVIDTGTGMDEETLKRAVEPFYSTKGIGKGTGLGLSMVHGLAMQLGGGMTIQSAPGVGTRIDLWLPLSQAQVEQSGEANSAPHLEACGRALVVDDEELVRLTTADMLQSLGYEVVEADGARQAKQILGSGQQFDLVVTDHLMPEVTGADLAASIRENWPDTRVLIISGYADAEGIAPGFERLAKPFRETELATAIAGLDQSATCG